MYESFYDLKKKPFQITTDPNFLWMGKKHSEALSTLKYGVMDNKGFLLLTGDVGTGKTTLINRLVEDIRGKAYTAKVPDPGLSKYDFYRMVSRYFGLPIEVRTKSDFLDPFSRFLNDAYEEKKSVLLLIDEAQRLKNDLMEEIRLLSNLERQDAKLLNIFFVGQNEFNSILLQPENRALMRRITITYNIDSLDQAETCEYIHHRLKIAGAGYEIFSNAAMEEVYEFSNGFPRQINIICDLSMFFASQVSTHTISRRIVHQCRKRLSFPVDPVPDETRRQFRPKGSMPQPSIPSHRRDSAISLTRLAMVAVMLLIIISCGLYLIPGSAKNRFSNWVGENWTVLFPKGEISTENESPESPDSTLETTTKGLNVDETLPLNMPRRPPDMTFSETSGLIITGEPVVPVPLLEKNPPMTMEVSRETVPDPLRDQ